MSDQKRERKDKRDECGCHKGCTTLMHAGEVPCVWPSCLTEQEHAELMQDLEETGW